MRPPNAARYALLGLLQKQPRHGYDLFREFRDPRGLGLVWHLGMSLMYQELKKLEAAGLVKASVELQDVRPPKKMYALTPQGRRVFRAWMAAPAHGMREMRVDFLIRLFFAGRARPGEVRQLAENQTTRLRGELEALCAAEAQATDAGEFSQKVRQFRIRQTEAALAWLAAFEAAAEEA